LGRPAEKCTKISECWMRKRFLLSRRRAPKDRDVRRGIPELDNNIIRGAIVTHEEGREGEGRCPRWGRAGSGNMLLKGGLITVNKARFMNVWDRAAQLEICKSVRQDALKGSQRKKVEGYPASVGGA